MSLLYAFVTEFNSRFINIKNNSELFQDTLVISDFMDRQFRNATGGMAPPAAMIKVENACNAVNPLPACGQYKGVKTDRLVVMSFDAQLPECSVTEERGGRRYVFGTGPTCCLSAAMARRHFVLSLKPNFIYGLAELNISRCEIRLRNSRFSRFDSARSSINWVGATVTFFTPYEFYLDAQTGEFRRFTDINGDNNIDPQEVATLSNAVVDFQAAYGYDVLPDATGNLDGLASNTNSATDEWLYNNAGDNPNAAPFLNVNYDQLKMVGIGIVFKRQRGEKEVAYPVSVLNGPVFDDPDKFYQKQVLNYPLVIQ